MRKHLFIFFLSSLVILNSCSDNEGGGTSKEIITTDISISSSESLISWVETNDLAQKIEQVLSYNYGLANESEIEKEQIFNVDSTQVFATIDFKAEFQDIYNDSNPSNNSVTINLERNKTVELKADGPGDTYALITSVLAPGNSPIEAPDCSHNDFGEHIDELFDDELNGNVFRFHIHTTPDDDRCIIFDRQRNEIKSYDKSPDNLLGVENELVNYNWKFKLNDGFQPSPKFTHLHQLKSVGGPLASHPMYTITARKGSPDKLELRYGETDSSVKLVQEELEPFVGVWLEVNETIKYGMNGSYDIEIKKVSDGTILLAYSNQSIINWRQDADFVRPKWGIYRSLEFEEDLRDEEVLFADFKITEIN